MNYTLEKANCGCTVISLRRGKHHIYDLHKLDFTMRSNFYTDDFPCYCKRVANEYIVPCKYPHYERRCTTCNIYVDRMFEYFQNPHPCMKGLTKKQYIDGAARARAIADMASRLAAEHYFNTFALQFLNKDVKREIIMVGVYIDCKNFRFGRKKFLPK